MSPLGSGIVLDIPLIPGESITTQRIRVTQGVVKVTLGADQTDLGWESFLEPSGQIRFVHEQTDSWTEIWKVDISPIFHLAYEGIPVIFYKNRYPLVSYLALSIKSSNGGQHPLTLPATAKLQEIRIKGKSAPIRQEGQQVALPIISGQQNIVLKWIESKPMTPRCRSSRVDLGVVSVNASVDIYLPANRWPLFIGGEQLVGPAVLFWSVIIIIFLGAFFL